MGVLKVIAEAFGPAWGQVSSAMDMSGKANSFPFNNGLSLYGNLVWQVSSAMDINPFAPSIMMSLGIAICFDYV